MSQTTQRVVYKSKIPLVLHQTVTSFAVGSGFQAVRVEDGFHREGNDINEKPLERLQKSDSIQFSFVTDEGLHSLHEGEALSRLGLAYVFVKKPTQWGSAKLSSTNWDDLIAGHLVAECIFSLPERTLNFDPSKGRMEAITSMCPLITKRLLNLPENKLLAAVRTVMGIPRMSSKDGWWSYDERVNFVMRQFIHPTMDRGGIHPLRWCPSDEEWERVLSRMVTDFNSDKDEGILGPDGRTYPVDFSNALDKALLALYPEVAALLGGEPALSPTR